jgi:hypothetical protein
MVHSMTGHDLVFDPFFEQEHAFIKGLHFKCKQILNLISLIIDPFELQTWNINVLSFE